MVYIQGNAIEDKNDSSAGQIGRLNQLLDSPTDSAKSDAPTSNVKLDFDENDESQKQISFLNALVPEMDKPKTEAQRILEMQKEKKETIRCFENVHTHTHIYIHVYLCVRPLPRRARIRETIC